MAVLIPHRRRQRLVVIIAYAVQIPEKFDDEPNADFLGLVDENVERFVISVLPLKVPIPFCLSERARRLAGKADDFYVVFRQRFERRALHRGVPLMGKRIVKQAVIIDAQPIEGLSVQLHLPVLAIQSQPPDFPGGTFRSGAFRIGRGGIRRPGIRRSAAGGEGKEKENGHSPAYPPLHFFPTFQCLFSFFANRATPPAITAPTREAAPTELPQPDEPPFPLPADASDDEAESDALPELSPGLSPEPPFGELSGPGTIVIEEMRSR